MKQIIKDVLDDMSESQINLGSETARKTISNLITVALKSKGVYSEYGDTELEEQRARESWVCEICGESTYDVDWDYIGSGTNHLGCELKSQEEIDEYVEDIDEQAYAQGRGSSYDYDMGIVPGSRELDDTPEDDSDTEKGPSLTSAPGRVPDEEDEEINKNDRFIEETCPKCDQHPYSETDRHCPVCFDEITKEDK